MELHDQSEQLTDPLALKRADESGRAVFQGVPEGKYYVSLKYRGAAPAALPLPARGEALVKARLATGRRVTVVIGGSPQEPVGTARVHLIDAKTGFFLSSRWGLRTGAFALKNVPSGPFRIAVRTYDEPILVGVADVSDEQEVSLTLAKPIDSPK